MDQTTVHTRSLWIGGGWILAVTITAFYLSPLRRGLPPDFAQFYLAARLVAAGEVRNLYHQPAYEPLKAELVAAGETLPASQYFNRPAFDAFLWAPLALFAYRTAAYVTLGANLVLFGVVIWKLPSWFPVATPVRMWLFCFMPFTWSIFWGQDTLLLTLLISYGVHLVLQKREIPAGVVLALATFKPHLVWGVPVALLVLGKRKAVLSFLGSATILALLSLASVGWDGVREWYVLLQAPSTDQAPQFMGNLRALRIAFGSAIYGLAVLLTLASASITLSRGSSGDRIAAAVLSALLLSPHTYWQDYALVAPAALLSGCLPVIYAVLLPWPYFYSAEGMLPFIVLLLVCQILMAVRSLR